MSPPTRRRVLGSGLIVGLGAITGCLGSPSGPQSPDGTPEPVPSDRYDTLTYNGEVDLDRRDAPFAQRAVGPYYLAVLGGRAHAQTVSDPLESEQARSFLTATDFYESVVVVLQDVRGQSSPDLAVQTVTRAPDYVDLAVVYPGEGATADVIEDMLFVRIPHDGAPPTHATVTVGGLRGDATTFSTVGRYGRASLREPRDVVVRNRDCVAYHVTITGTIDGELVYTPTRLDPYDPGTAVRFRDVLTEVGDYRFRIRSFAGEASANTTTSRASLSNDTDPRGVLVDISGDGSVSVSALPAADLPTSGTGTCQSSELPYESTDPRENLPQPARITWANRSDSGRTVRIIVRDGETTVIDRRLDLPARGKGRTEGLIAKMGVYHTELRPVNGSSVMVEGHVDETNPDLQLMVDGNGELNVATASQQ